MVPEKSPTSEQFWRWGQRSSTTKVITNAPLNIFMGLLIQEFKVETSHIWSCHLNLRQHYTFYITILREMYQDHRDSCIFPFGSSATHEIVWVWCVLNVLCCMSWSWSCVVCLSFTLVWSTATTLFPTSLVQE